MAYDAILSAITVDDFKAQFSRDFLYIPNLYANDKNYFQNDIVAFAVGLTINYYQCIVASSIGVDPTNNTNWQPYNLIASKYVQDSDISKAFLEAFQNVNPNIFENNDVKKLAFFYCAAHFLSKDLTAAEHGIDSKGTGIISSQSVGSVSASYYVPTDINGIWAFFNSTEYGQKYLSFVRPRVIGRIGIARGATLP